MAPRLPGLQVAELVSVWAGVRLGWHPSGLDHGLTQPLLGLLQPALSSWLSKPLTPAGV